MCNGVVVVVVDVSNVVATEDTVEMLWGPPCDGQMEEGRNDREISNG